MPGEPGPGVFLPYNEPYLAYEKRQAEAAK